MASEEYERVLAGLADPDTRFSTLADLQDSELRNAAAIAAPFLRDEDPEVRFFAVECLLARGGKRYANRVRPLLRDHDHLVRVSAVECVARWLIRDAWRRVLRLVRDRDDLVRGYAVWTLKELGAVEAVSKLRNRLGRERNVEVKAALLEALAVLDDDDKCARRLETLLKHTDKNVRDRAANCLVGVADYRKPEQFRRLRCSLQEAVLAERDKGVRLRLRQNLEMLLEG